MPLSSTLNSELSAWMNRASNLTFLVLFCMPSLPGPHADKEKYHTCERTDCKSVPFCHMPQPPLGSRSKYFEARERLALLHGGNASTSCQSSSKKISKVSLTRPAVGCAPS